jgi:hypothetical protein
VAGEDINVDILESWTWGPVVRREVLRGARKANLSRIFQLFPSQDPALQRELVYGPGARLLERTYRLSAYGKEKLTPKPPAELVAEAAP